MKDKDNRLIYEAYDSPEKRDIIEKLKRLQELYPEDAVINWSISDGSFSSLTPQGLLGDQPENKTIKALIGVLMKIWTNPGYAQKLGLAGADWSGKNSYSDSIFWTANDTHYHDIYGKGYTDEFQRIKPEHKKSYEKFFSDKRKADNYVSKLVGGRPEARDPGEVTPETFANQKYWRISLSPDSKQISNKADATHDSVGYGKGRYMGD